MDKLNELHIRIKIKTAGRGVGLLLLTHTSLKATQVKSTSNLQEVIFTEIPLENRKKVLTGCMCRSPNSAPENNEKLCEELSLRTLRYIYDTMLVRNINWEQNSTPGGDTTSCDYRFLEAIKDCFMYQHETQPTIIIIMIIIINFYSA